MRSGASWLLLLVLAGCAPTAEQQAAAFAPSGSASSIRARQSRQFDTVDRALMLQSTIATLQDLGFTIEESQADTGVVVGSRLGNGRVRAQVTIGAMPQKGGTTVRVIFQRIVPRPGAMLPFGETLDDPALYQGFFERVAQSAFLTAHEI